MPPHKSNKTFDGSDPYAWPVCAAWVPASGFTVYLLTIVMITLRRGKFRTVIITPKTRPHKA